MSLNINLDKLFDFVKQRCEAAQSTDELEEIMDDAKRYLMISYSIRED